MTKSVEPKKSQVERFREAARDVETDDREESFDRALKRVAKAAPEVMAKANKKLRQ